MNKVLESTEYVVKKSWHVSIDKKRLTEFSQGFQHGNLSRWLSASPFDFSKLNDDEKLNFLLVFNSISFSYWGEPKWAIKYRGDEYDGSWAMVMCIKRAMDEGVPILNSEFRASMPRGEFSKFLRGNVEVPLFEERFNITREVAKILVDKFGGNFTNPVQEARNDAMELLDIVISNFNSFDDKSFYNRQQISFYKRAQLLISDIYQLFGGEGYGAFNKVDQITACADYKLPQALRRLGILNYSGGLAEKVDNKIEIAKNSEEEIEIRANTIWAVELIRRELVKLGKDIMPIGINDHLWLMAQNKPPDDKPYHRTRTTAY